jgi:exodeoxyribonuclease VII small subunit
MSSDEESGQSEKRKRSRSAAAGRGSSPATPLDPKDDPLDREVAALKYEDALERLESIIERVEHGEIGLEETLDEYRRGRALLRRCQGILDTAEQEIRRLSLADLERSAEGGASGRSDGSQDDDES